MDFLVCDETLNKNSHSTSTNFYLDFPNNPSFCPMKFTSSPNVMGDWNNVISDSNIVIPSNSNYRISTTNSDGVCIEKISLNNVMLNGELPFWLDSPCESPYHPVRRLHGLIIYT